MKHLRFFSNAVLSALFAVGVYTSAQAAPIAQGLEDLQGRPAEIQSAKDKVLVTFWATWCKDCRSKMKAELVEWSKLPQVDVVAVNTDKDLDRVQAFVKEEGITLNVLRDPSKEFRKKMKVVAVPHWAVFQKKKEGTEVTWTVVDSAPAFEMDRVKKALGI